MTKALRVLMTDRQRAAVDAVAARAGLPTSTFVRDLALRAADRPAGPSGVALEPADCPRCLGRGGDCDDATPDGCGLCGGWGRIWRPVDTMAAVEEAGRARRRAARAAREAT